MIKRCVAFVAAVLLFCGMAGCAGTPPESTKKLSVIATVFPPYDFVRAIAGDRVELTLLLKPGTDSHSYTPSLSDIVDIERCDLFLYTGGESDLWAKEMLDTCGKSDVSALAMTDAVPLLEEETVEGMEHEHHHHEDGICEDPAHHHDESVAYDEHVWTTPSNAKRIVSAITALLCEKDPAYADTYRQNQIAYTAKLDQLAVQLHDIAQNAKRRTLVFAERFPFRYLTHELSLTYYAAFSGCASATDVTLKTLTFLTETVKENGIPVIFYTEFSDQTVAQLIARETGAVPRKLHSCHMVTEAEWDKGVTYCKLIQQNIDCLREALCE